MKKSITALALVLMFALSAPAPAQAASPKGGAKCTSVGEVKTVFSNSKVQKGKSFVCVKNNKKIYWSKAEVVPRIQSKLSVSQVWKGNAVELSLLDSSGTNCGLSANKEIGECKGFYIGWGATFKDEDRKVDYSKEDVTTISDLELGDKGYFYLMYQAAEGANPVIVKGFAFNYSY